MMRTDKLWLIALLCAVLGVAMGVVIVQCFTAPLSGEVALEGWALGVGMACGIFVLVSLVVEKE